MNLLILSLPILLLLLDPIRPGNTRLLAPIAQIQPIVNDKLQPIAIALLGQTHQPKAIPNALYPASLLNWNAITTLEDFAKQTQKLTGLAIAWGEFDPKSVIGTAGTELPAWSALDNLAQILQAKFVVENGGNTIVFKRGRTSQVVASHAGAFRFFVRQISCRLDLIRDERICELQLDLHWEPRLAVVRSDAVPKILALQDDRESKLAAFQASGKVPTTASQHSFKLTITGIPRAAKELKLIEGMIQLTAAERRLKFEFSDMTATQVQPKTQAGVIVKLLPSLQKADGLITRLDIEYPDTHPDFESYESWASQTRCFLRTNNQVYESQDYELPGGSRRERATYRFAIVKPKTDLRKWSLAYELPAHLREIELQFRLSAIPLP